MKVICGECRYFVRDGKCDWHRSADAKRSDRPFSHAPFWVWSDCYSDKEQVRRGVTSACPTFESALAASGDLDKRLDDAERDLKRSVDEQSDDHTNENPNATGA